MLQPRPEPAKPDGSLSIIRPGSLSDDDCTALLQWMLRHDTTAQQAREAGFVDELSRYLAGRGIASRKVTGDEGRANLIANLDSGRPGPHLVFCGHCDTVPLGDREWKSAPFGGTIKGGRIHGRGSSDMKGGLAALVASLLDMQANENWSGRLSLAVTYGEETGSEGARLMAADGSLGPFDAMIIAEPTSNLAVRSHKGALWLLFTATGRTGHGSMPQMGLNALEMVVRFRQRLLELDALAASDPLLGRPTICLTRLQGGTQVNVIPDRAIAEFDMRTLPGQCHDDILEAIRAIAHEIEAEYEGGKIVVETIKSLPALATPAGSAIVRAALDVRQDLRMPAAEAGGASYFTDGSVLQSLGADILILGPGDPGEAHQTDESLDLSDFLAARQIYTGIARRFLSSPE
ncbi:M20 family metallopeptidase [Aminobacter aganoensis]|uniref:Succinyl-diaminopimelate desuccinylase n=1 Tax=Aminobacter aganoensis TaxID=83264 RepID=A0A7X0FAT8_9HYPH|nr:succinyl-diaminopimelate desuccinylase [Aminobacter aganoensis]